MKEQFNQSFKRFQALKAVEKRDFETILVYLPNVMIEQSDGMMCFANPEAAYILLIDGEGYATNEKLEPMERLAHALAVGHGYFE